MSNISNSDDHLKGHEPSSTVSVDFTHVGRPTSTRKAAQDNSASETLALLLPTLGMEFPEQCLYGLAGEIVKRLMPETESHPAAILLHILTRFGSIIGRTAHYVAESTEHYGNLFVVIVGKTSKGRKGTANDQVEKIFRGIDPPWENTCQSGGFGSGEGVIHAIRDDRTDKKGKAMPGVHDKRIFIREGEFSRILQTAKREGNLLSQIMRDGWDGKSLRNNVKTDPATATDPHMSCICDITINEINLRLDQADRLNGFANRFLWVFVERTKLKPFGGRDIDWSHEQAQLRAAVKFASEQKRIFMTEAARRMWSRNYRELSKDRDGIVGGVTSRSEAQVIRLALLFAMLDRKDHIWSCHLQAARTVWDYCLRSVSYIFGESGLITDEQRRMLDEVKQGPTSQADFYRLFNCNRPSGLIKADIEALEAKGLFAKVQDEKGVDQWVLGPQTGVI